MKTITYSFGSYRVPVLGYHWATNVLDQLLADRASEMAEHPDRPEGFDEAEGFHDLGAGTSGRLPFQVFPRLPSGQVLLHEAIRGFCAIREGKPVDNIDLSRFQELADPIRTALLGNKIEVTCLTREGERTTVSGDAFGDDETWRRVVYAPNSIPIRPKVGIGDGHLVIVQAAFDRVLSGEAPADQTEPPSARYIPPTIAYAIELADRFDLSPDYKFNRGRMAQIIITLAHEEEPNLNIGDEKASYLATFLGHPIFDKKVSDNDPKVVGVPSISLARKHGMNVGRPPDPSTTHRGIDYPRPRKRLRGDLSS